MPCATALHSEHIQIFKNYIKTFAALALQVTLIVVCCGSVYRTGFHQIYQRFYRNAAWWLETAAVFRYAGQSGNCPKNSAAFRPNLPISISRLANFSRLWQHLYCSIRLRAFHLRRTHKKDVQGSQKKYPFLIHGGTNTDTVVIVEISYWSHVLSDALKNLSLPRHIARYSVFGRRQCYGGVRSWYSGTSENYEYLTCNKQTDSIRLDSKMIWQNISIRLLYFYNLLNLVIFY